MEEIDLYRIGSNSFDRILLLIKECKCQTYQSVDMNTSGMLYESYTSSSLLATAVLFQCRG